MTNKNIIMSSFKSSRDIQKKEGGPDCTVSNIKLSSVTLNELAMKARERISIVISSFNKTAYKKTDINPNVVQILKTCLEYMGLKYINF